MSTSTITLAELRTEARYRADMVNSQFVTDTELNSYINSRAFELYDLLVTLFGNDYYVTVTSNQTTDGINQLYALPTNFYKLLGVDLLIAGGQNAWVTVKTFKFNERNQFAIPNIQTLAGVTNLRYRLNGSSVMFNLIPMGGQTFRFWYIPQMVQLVADADTLDGISGWYEYVIIDAAIKMLQKEESDCSILLAQKQAIIQRINASAENRDAGDSQCVSDTSSTYDEFSGNGPFGGY